MVDNTKNLYNIKNKNINCRVLDLISVQYRVWVTRVTRSRAKQLFPKLGVFENIILRKERLSRSSESVLYKSGKKRAYLFVCKLLRNNRDVNIILWKLRDLLLVWLKSSHTGDNSIRSAVLLLKVSHFFFLKVTLTNT